MRIERTTKLFNDNDQEIKVGDVVTLQTTKEKNSWYYNVTVTNLLPNAFDIELACGNGIKTSFRIAYRNILSIV